LWAFILLCIGIEIIWNGYSSAIHSPPTAAAGEFDRHTYWSPAISYLFADMPSKDRFPVWLEKDILVFCRWLLKTRMAPFSSGNSPSGGHESVPGRTGHGHAGHRGRHALRPYGGAPLRLCREKLTRAPSCHCMSDTVPRVEGEKTGAF
jgi:hypothetical protein